MKEISKRNAEITKELLLRQRLEYLAPDVLQCLKSLLVSLNLECYPASRFDLAFQTQIAYRKSEALCLINKIEGV